MNRIIRGGWTPRFYQPQTARYTSLSNELPVHCVALIDLARQAHDEMQRTADELSPRRRRPQKALRAFAVPLKSADDQAIPDQGIERIAPTGILALLTAEQFRSRPFARAEIRQDGKLLQVDRRRFLALRGPGVGDRCRAALERSGFPASRWGGKAGNHHLKRITRGRVRGGLLFGIEDARPQRGQFVRFVVRGSSDSSDLDSFVSLTNYSVGNNTRNRPN